MAETQEKAQAQADAKADAQTEAEPEAQQTEAQNDAPAQDDAAGDPGGAEQPATHGSAEYVGPMSTGVEVNVNHPYQATTSPSNRSDEELQGERVLRPAEEKKS